jgi:hypothetical protein
MENNQSPNLIAKEYKKVIAAFKNRYDVQNGTAIGYRPGQDPNAELPFENWPKSIGQGLTTTGFCVTASQALLFDKVFQFLLQQRGALAKLVSIDIKEQYYGKTFSGNPNKWHTAVLVYDSGINFIIDLTCAQFGNNFVGKDVWDFQTWEKTFRSPADKHKIIDFNNQELSYSMFTKQANNFNELKFVEAVNALTDITTLSENERKVLVEFFMKHIDVVNKKLTTGSINKIDFEYFTTINKLMQQLDFLQFPKQYHVMEFSTKEIALDWIKRFVEKSGITNQFFLTSDSIEGFCKHANIDSACVNTESLKEKTYIVFEFTDLKTYEIKFLENINSCVPYGIKLNFDYEKDILNGGKLLSEPVLGVTVKTNTIFIRCSN